MKFYILYTKVISNVYRVSLNYAKFSYIERLGKKVWLTKILNYLHLAADRVFCIVSCVISTLRIYFLCNNGCSLGVAKKKK